VKRQSLLLVALLFVFSFALVACAPKEPSKTEPAGEGDKELKIAYITNASINDGGWNQACYGGMIEAAAKYNFATQYVENIAEADYVSVIADYSNMGYDLIFLPGNEYTDAVIEVAETHPDTGYIMLNGLISYDNIMSIKADNYEMGFAAGVLAGLRTRSNAIGYIAAQEITTSKENLSGYRQGAHLVNPNITVSDAYTNSWTDSAKGKELAISMISTNDTDVFFGNAGQIDTGVREGASEYENRWTIAQPSESLDQAPQSILTSIITDNTSLTSLAIEAFLDGTFGDRVVEGGFADKVLTIGKFGDSAKEFEAEFMEIIDKLIAGDVTIDRDVK
jgi:basic membrane protein A